jgi:hypothetical protein
MAGNKIHIRRQLEYFVALRRGTATSNTPTLDELRQEVARAEKQVQKAIDGRSKLLGRIKKTGVLESPDASRTREFQKLLEHPLIEKVSVDTSIIVRTRMIYIRYDRQRYEIGRFVIRLNPDTQRVSFENLTRVVFFDCQHPHIKNRIPCWGNIGPTVAQLFRERQYIALVHVCLQFLQSYVRDVGHGPFCEITYWPLASSTGASQYN